jgi:anti-anti-sigma factor
VKHELTVERTTDSGADAIVYRLSGVLGETQAVYELLEEVRRDIGKMPGRIIFSLKGVERVTSPGIGVLAACYTTAKNAGRTFVLAAVPKQTKSVLDVTGMSAVLTLFATEKDALTAKR